MLREYGRVTGSVKRLAKPQNYFRSKLHIFTAVKTTRRQTVLRKYGRATGSVNQCVKVGQATKLLSF